MILRVFRARLRPGQWAVYERLLRERSVPLMRATPGFGGLRIGPRQIDRPDEFVLVTLWSDIDALQTFAGERWEEVTTLPGEAALVEEMSVQHFDDQMHSLTDIWSVLAEVAREREEHATREQRLSDSQWERIVPLLPRRAREGRPRSDDRRTLDGILYVLRTGCRWQGLPRTYGSGVTCWRRLAQLEASGAWDEIWSTYLNSLDGPGRLIWTQAVLAGSCRPRQRRNRARAG